jgi:hypothetical protein
MIKIKLTQVVLKHNAMIEVGINPQLMAIKRPSIRHKNKKTDTHRRQNQVLSQAYD